MRKKFQAAMRSVRSLRGGQRAGSTGNKCALHSVLAEPKLRLETHPALAQGVTVIPAEQVVLHVIELPCRTERQRRQALPYALEERLAEAPEDVHVASLGTQAGVTLAAVVSSCAMQAATREAPSHKILPELFAVPIPDDDDWAVDIDGDRALVRQRDGTGFVVKTDALSMIWERAGRPATAFYESAPKEFRNRSGVRSMPRPDPDLQDLLRDLRQGTFARPTGWVRNGISLAATICLGAILHLALAIVDLRALQSIADNLRSDTEALLSETLPAATIFDDPRILQKQILSENAVSDRAGAMTLLERASAAFLAADAAITVVSASWEAETGAMSLLIEAPELTMLQTAEEALRIGGLDVTSGTATADGGSARVTLTLRENV